MNNLSELDTSKVEGRLHPELRNATPDSRVRVDVTIGGGLYTQAAVTNIVYAFVAELNNQYPYLWMLNLESSLKANLRLGSAADQHQRSGLQGRLRHQIRDAFGLGNDAGTVLGLLSKLLKLGSKLIPELTTEDVLFSSPLGEARASLTTYNQGERGPLRSGARSRTSSRRRCSGTTTSSASRSGAKEDDGKAEMLIGRDALRGEKDFAFDWAARSNGRQ